MSEHEFVPVRVAAWNDNSLWWYSRYIRWEKSIFPFPSILRSILRCSVPICPSDVQSQILCTFPQGSTFQISCDLFNFPSRDRVVTISSKNWVSIDIGWPVRYLFVIEKWVKFAFFRFLTSRRYKFLSQTFRACTTPIERFDGTVVGQFGWSKQSVVPRLPLSGCTSSSDGQISAILVPFTKYQIFLSKMGLEVWIFLCQSH